MTAVEAVRMTRASAGRAAQALHQRLTAVAGEFLDPSALPATGGLGSWAEAAAALLMVLVDELRQGPDRPRIWLLLVALSGTFPFDEEVRATQRTLELTSTESAVVWLLEAAHAAAHGRATGLEELHLLCDGVVVDVDFTAKHDVQTGVQRVVRRLLPRWHRAHGVELAVWAHGAAGLRELTPVERGRVLHWAGPVAPAGPSDLPAPLLVPWRSTVVLPEVPERDQSCRLASLAQNSNNRVVLIGHDCIPVLSAELMPDSEPMRFVRFLTVVKWASVVAAVSESAAAEFRGFVATLPNQGLTGPNVVACPLANDPPVSTVHPAVMAGIPEVVVIGSHDPRKNHLAVLQAAEVLWRRGLEFRLRFLGASGWTTDLFDEQLARLVRAGRQVTAERGLPDDELWSALRGARFSVFPSLHEGFGLPVVESLSLGTPVIGSDFGSIAELARDGGIALVDPRDDEALAEAMQRLLVDDDEVERLRAAAAQRPVRTWDDYSAELWCAVMGTP